jgi:hypothetical protein
MTRLMGYGVLEVVELTDDRAVFRVYDNVECMSLKGVEGQKTQCSEVYWLDFSLATGTQTYTTLGQKRQNA